MFYLCSDKELSPLRLPADVPDAGGGGDRQRVSALVYVKLAQHVQRPKQQAACNRTTRTQRCLSVFLRALRPARTVLRPARLYSALPEFEKKKKNYLNFFFLLNVIAVFVFSDRDVKMLVIFLQICAHVFIDHPQNCAQTSFRSCAGLRPNFGHSRSKLCSIISLI